MENKVRQAHGANRGGHCGVCKETADAKQLAVHITKGEVLRCGKDGCDGPVKPDITFFGEGLPPAFFESWDKIKDVPDLSDGAEPDAKLYPDGGCDLMIVIGTALAVGPFNDSVNKIKDGCPCILFNMEAKTPKDNGFDF